MDSLVCYDICEKRRLRTVEKFVKSFGFRVQKSVFECSLNETMLDRLVNGLKKIIDPSVDQVRIYPLLQNARGRQTIIGIGYAHQLDLLIGAPNQERNA